jgi:hypothetical protein
LHGDTLVPKLRGMHVSASDMVLLLLRQQPINCTTSLTSLQRRRFGAERGDASETIRADHFARGAGGGRIGAALGDPALSTGNRLLLIMRRTTGRLSRKYRAMRASGRPSQGRGRRFVGSLPASIATPDHREKTRGFTGVCWPAAFERDKKRTYRRIIQMISMASLVSQVPSLGS